MMGFQNLRPNNTLYILYKSIPKLEIGKVNSVSPPIPKFIGNFSDMVVDISATVNDTINNFQKIPANAEIADIGNNIIISSNKQIITDEIYTLKQRSQDIISSIDFHTKVVQDCEDFIKILNPEIAEKEQRDYETKQLKEEISSLKEMSSNFVKQFKQ